MANKDPNMIIVTDPYGRQKTILTNSLPKTPRFFDDGHQEQLDGLLTYQFATLASDPDTKHLQAGNNVIVRNKDRKLMLFTIIRTREERRDGKYVRTVFAENAAVDDLYNTIVKGEKLVSISAQDAATKVLEGTGWKLGIIDYAGLQNVDLSEYPTALAALHKIRDIYGLEMEFTVNFMGTQVRERFVHLVKKRGQVTGKRFTYAKDLIGVSREEDRSDLATAIIPVGKADEKGNRLTMEEFENVHDGYVSPKGQAWVGDDNALQQFGKNGKHLFKRLDLSSADNQYLLMQEAVAELRRCMKPRLTYEVSVLLLEQLTKYEHEKVRLGDTILVKDTTFDPALAVQARVIEIYRSYTDPTKDRVVLGEFVPLVIDKNKQIEAIQNTINQNMSKWEQGGEVVYKSVNEPPLADRKPDMLWLDLTAKPNVMRRWDAENKRWVNASATTAAEVGAETPKGAQDKANKAEETAIAEAAEDAAIKAKQAEDNAVEKAEEMDEEIKIELKSYVEGLTEEVEAAVKEHADQVAKDAELNAQIFTEGYAQKEFHYGDTPPKDTTQLWFDLSSNPNKIRRYDESSKTWVAASPTSPSDIGAASIQETVDEANRAREEAITKAKEEASQAKKDAIAEAKELDKVIKSEAERLSQAAEEAAKGHADDITKQVEEALKQDSQDKANAAKEGALSEADQRIQAAKKEAEQNAKKEAEALAEAARKKAEEAAAADAKKKADEAREQAKKDAALDAKNKADAAEKAATDRANAVEKDVKEFASNAGNITKGTIAAERLYGGTIDAQKANIVNINAGSITTGELDAARIKAGSIKADQIEFGGRLRNVSGNAPTTYTSGDLVGNGMTGADSTAVPRWIVKQFPATATVDLGNIVGEVVRVGFTTYYTTDARYTPKSFKLETSLNNTTWEVVADVTNNTVSPLSYTFGGRQVRYVRLTIREAQPSQTTVNIANFEVMATQGGSILTGDSILTGRIDATKVNVDNLNAGNIRSGTLNADRIGAGSINASKIAAGSITAEKVAANAITADKVAANAITADKLHVLAKSLVANTSLTGNDSTGWNVSKHATSTIGLRGSTNMGDVLVHGFTTAEHDQPTLYNSNYFEVDPNQTYKFSIGMYLPSNPRDASQYFGFNAYDKNQKELPVYFVNPNGTNIDPTERTNPYFWSGKDISGSWRMMDGYVMSSQGQANECPSGRNVHQNFKMHPATKYLRMRFYSGYYPTVKNKAMEVLWHSPSVTAVDSGMIIADKIVTGSLDASKVNVKNINAGNITTGGMSADRISSGTIDARKINVIGLNAGNIVSGTIDASKISVINLDASKITSGMLNVGGTQIAKGTDFMRKDWKPLRASIAHSINENYLILGGAQAKEEYVYLPRFDLNGGGGEKVTLSYEYNVDANYAVLPEIFVLAAKQTTEALIDSVNHDYVHVLAGSESPEDIGGGWKRVKKTFAIQNDIKSAVLRLDHNGSKDGKTCNYRYRRVMLNYGSVALTWSPHTDESIGIGAITADKIRAGAITTNKLTVGDFTNLVPNSAFINGTIDEWDRGSVVAATSAGVPAGAPTNFVRTQTERDTYVGDWFAVKQGDRFYCELTAATSNSGVPISLGLHYVDKDNKPYWTVFTPRIDPTGGKWVTQGGEIHVSIANATKAKVFVQVDGTTGSTFGTWYLTNAKIHRKTDANLLVDGSVTASKIVANAITADKVAANAVTADKIAANAVTAAKIAAGNITADKIAAGSITTDKIAAAGITADKITSGVLDANRVQVKNLNASVITAGTMSADRITGGTINAMNTNIINLKAQNIASGTLNADNVTISNGRVTINKDGVTVTDANFLVRDAKTGLLHTTLTSTNLLYDHSFELLKSSGNSPIGSYYLDIDWTTISPDINDSFYKWARVGTPKMIDALGYDVPTEAAPFGLRSGLFNQSNYAVQRFGATAGKQYTISFHTGKPYGGLAAGAPRLIIEHMKDNSVVASETKDFAVPNANVGDVVRYGVTITANAGIAGGRTSSIRVRFLTTNANWCAFDGVQAVTGDRAAPYDAEDSFWKFSQQRLSPPYINAGTIYANRMESDTYDFKYLRGHKQRNILIDHKNNNVTLSAADGNLHLGYEHTQQVFVNSLFMPQKGINIQGKNATGNAMDAAGNINTWGGNIKAQDGDILTNWAVKAAGFTFMQHNTPIWAGEGTMWYGWQGATMGLWIFAGGAFRLIWENKWTSG
ncbi:phage tail protein [Bacillus cereus]|nr:phage tail protein [Bacillus cereus]